MMRNQRMHSVIAVLFLSLCLLLPLQPAGASGLLSYQQPGSNAQVKAVLYFRYLNSPYLSPETRDITVPHTESLELALVKELLKGPSGSTDLLSGLFPRGTQVLSVLGEGRRLFVTFSKQIENPLESENAFSKNAIQEAQLRRRLLMASLVNTLSEYGAYQEVQVLILRDSGTHHSMRVSDAFYLEDSGAIPAPLTRQEDRIITPGKALEMMLTYWQNQNWSALMKVVAIPGDAGGTTMKLADLQQLPALLTVNLSEGRTAPTGDRAVVMLDAEMKKKDGDTVYLHSFPVLLLRNHQGWLLSLSSLTAILEAGT